MKNHWINKMNDDFQYFYCTGSTKDVFLLQHYLLHALALK